MTRSRLRSPASSIDFSSSANPCRAVGEHGGPSLGPGRRIPPGVVGPTNGVPPKCPESARRGGRPAASPRPDSAREPAGGPPARGPIRPRRGIRPTPRRCIRPPPEPDALTPDPLPPPAPVPAPRSVLSPWQRPLVHALVVGVDRARRHGPVPRRHPGRHAGVGERVPRAPARRRAARADPARLHRAPRDRPDPARPVVALSGAGVLLLALAIACTGVILLLEPTSRPDVSTWAIHVYGGFALFALYALHRMFGSNPARGWILGASFGATVAARRRAPPLGEGGSRARAPLRGRRCSRGGVGAVALRPDQRDERRGRARALRARTSGTSRAARRAIAGSPTSGAAARIATRR